MQFFSFKHWRFLLTAVLALGALAPAAILLSAFGHGPINRGDTLAASPLDQALLERGAYLATAANCVSCHTAKGGEAFAGGLAFNTPFGTVYSTNITPDIDSGIGSWTYAEFERSMRRGVGDGGEHLYPVFPYTSFTKISDDDMRALFAFFRSVPAVRSEAAENDMPFPFNQRWLLAGWKALFLKSNTLEAAGDQTPEWNRGAYLVEALAHCSACHTPRNGFGGEKRSKAFSGGVYVDEVPSGDYREWSAPNITPAASGLNLWSTDDIVDYLKVGKNTHAATFGPMNEVILNSTRHLNEDDLRAMATYIKSLPSIETVSIKTASAAAAGKIGRGQTLYDIHCGTCHQPTGLGAPETGARLAGSPVVQAEDPASLLNVIIYGPELPDPWPPIGAWKQMPSFNDKLKDDEIAALATYLRQEWGHRAGEVSVEDVKVQRPPFETTFKGLAE